VAQDEFSESFGQHEELTTRINRLLKGYARDAAMFKELIQNADDAKATEVGIRKLMKGVVETATDNLNDLGPWLLFFFFR
jgi:hypothetical protein